MRFCVLGFLGLISCGCIRFLWFVLVGVEFGRFVFAVWV